MGILLIRKKWLNLLLSYILFSMLTGCVAKFTPVSMPQEFLTNSSKVGLVWNSGISKAHFYNAGPGLIAHGIVLVANKGLIKKLNTIKIQPLMESMYIETFKNEFEFSNFTVATREPVINEWSEMTGSKTLWSEISKNNEIPAIFQQFVSENQLDHLIILDVETFGLTKQYGPFGVPLSDYKPMTRIAVYIGDAKTKQIIAMERSLIAESRIDGKADNPPEFKEAIDAMIRDFQEAIDNVFVFIFKKAP